MLLLLKELRVGELRALKVALLGEVLWVRVEMAPGDLIASS